MASVNISGAEILGLLEDYLQHLLDCEEFLLDLYRHEAKPLESSHKDHSSFDKEQIAAVLKFCQEHAAQMELVDQKKLRPAEALLAETARLKDAAKHVRTVSYALRYHLPDEWDVYKKAVAASGIASVQRPLRSRLDDLTGFDDSE